MPRTNNILVIRLSSLGDVLMSIPAVVAIRQRFAGARLTWLVEGSVGELLPHQTFVDRVVRFPRGAIEGAIRRGEPLTAGRTFASFLKELRGDEYDLLVDFHGIIKSALLASFIKARRRIGFSSTFAKEGSHLFYGEAIDSGETRIHKVERNMLLAGHIGANGRIPEVTISVPEDAKLYVENFLSEAPMEGPIVAINPFSSKGSLFKRWDMTRYAILARRIREELGASVLIIWGPGEEGEATVLREQAGGGACLACPTTVPQLAALLRRTRLYVGGDSGVMHLAAFAGVPVVAIFGPTDHKVNAPYSPIASVVRKELPCSPCKNKRCEDRRCLEQITVDDVLEAVKTRYEGGNSGP
jgi:heptosyltransferase-1